MREEPTAPGRHVPRRPRNMVVVLLDSLNRHMIGPYGANEFETPNLDRLAARSLRFDRHFAGSLPCMPARHDILVGALDFLWRPWGSIETWEDAVTFPLREAGIATQLVTDHPHLFEIGGENYHCDFGAWDYLRGHESDPWRTRPDPTWTATVAVEARPGFRAFAYDTSRTWFRSEEDFPGPKTMSAAAAWLDTNAGYHDRFLLFVDEFDPHEPFDTPEPWASRYDPEWDGPKWIWPPYVVGGRRSGIIDDRGAFQVRSNYGAKLSMIDHWLGRILDAMDRNGLWEDTALVLCTDHGHYLGDRPEDIWGKPLVPLYEQLVHTPLLVAWPGADPGEVDALTTNVDIHATICDVFEVEVEHRTHGRSFAPLVTGEVDSVRDWALAGFWNREVHVVDGHMKYARTTTTGGHPTSMWSNRWSTMPVEGLPQMRLPRPDRRATLDFMPGSDVPVIRQPFREGDLLPYWGAGPKSETHLLFDLDVDPDENENLAGTSRERDAEELLRIALGTVEAPDDVFVRLGLE